MTITVRAATAGATSGIAAALNNPTAVQSALSAAGVPSTVTVTTPATVVVAGSSSAASRTVAALLAVLLSAVMVMF